MKNLFHKSDFDSSTFQYWEYVVLCIDTTTVPTATSRGPIQSLVWTTFIQIKINSINFKLLLSSPPLVANVGCLEYHAEQVCVCVPALIMQKK